MTVVAMRASSVRPAAARLAAARLAAARLAAARLAPAWSAPARSATERSAPSSAVATDGFAVLTSATRGAGSPLSGGALPADAGDGVTRPDLLERRQLLACLHGERAALVETAARGRVDRAWRLGLEGPGTR